MRERTARVWRAIGVTVGAALLTASLGAPVHGAEGDDLVFSSILIGSTCTEVDNSEAGADYTIDLASASAGAVVDTQVLTDLPVGPAELCFATAIQGGDNLVIQPGVTERIVQVPRMRVKSIDRAGDRISIAGEDELDLVATILRCALGQGFSFEGCPLKATRSVVLDAEGFRTVDVTSTLDLRGHDLVRLTHTSEDGDVTHNGQRVPVLFLRRGSAGIDGILLPGKTVTYRLRTASGTIRGTGSMTGTLDAATDGTFRKNGSPVAVKSGNTVTGAVPNDLPLVIAAGFTQVDAANDRIKGRCYANQRWLIQNLGSGALSGKAKADGTFTADASTVGADLTPDSYIELLCMTKGGDVVEFQRGTPS